MMRIYRWFLRVDRAWFTGVFVFSIMYVIMTAVNLPKALYNGLYFVALAVGVTVMVLGYVNG